MSLREIEEVLSGRTTVITTNWVVMCVSSQCNIIIYAAPISFPPHLEKFKIINVSFLQNNEVRWVGDGPHKNPDPRSRQDPDPQQWMTRNNLELQSKQNDVSSKVALHFRNTSHCFLVYTLLVLMFSVLFYLQNKLYGVQGGRLLIIIWISFICMRAHARTCQVAAVVIS